MSTKTSNEVKKNIIVSGVQPTGEMHIGNYLGALKNFVELQDKYQCYFFIADLHSITGEYDPKEKPGQIIETFVAFLASGLDPDKCTLFVQSQIPAHTELAWIFNSITPISELERMTQYKDKSSKQKDNINAGLFDYPVLQAADILIYKPASVPVGQDQLQHLEMTNTIARKFNNKFGKTFTELKPMDSKPIKIMSLTHPDRKMSKSEPGSYIGMFDEPDVIKKKLSRAVTATDAPTKEMPAGVNNLFGLLAEFADNDTNDKFNKQYKDGSIKYSELKEALAEAMSKYFEPMRKKRDELLKNEDKIWKLMAEGSKKAKKVAQATLQEVKEKVGLI